MQAPDVWSVQATNLLSVLTADLSSAQSRHDLSNTPQNGKKWASMAWHGPENPCMGRSENSRHGSAMTWHGAAQDNPDVLWMNATHTDIFKKVRHCSSVWHYSLAAFDI